ncbi:50S ribosomal protein L16 [Desulfurococcus mucosus]|uniref:Large ribosomal subunit protein uL16 n=1 Tax=Desulfurococcus mucosus (strain ATCC 35584 / DSM 2162 / JCM 9187 / O7/1) TaxID=765177 RepID=E8RAE5_DESM0|nr:50S ribosomal protein L16 [Desulfurococcus mucosus]ADV64355.1 LSU ribosomal protein L10AE [Desulfurococcus mucosus DSM 2162]
MPLRPARCYTHFSGPPYTRKEYIPGVPQPKITKFEMGDPKLDYDYEVALVVEEAGQIRHNALEAARVMALKKLSVEAGENNFYLKVKVYPHHVIRENKMMAFAGADRLQDGMRLSFGKPIGTAARVYPGQEIIVIRVKAQHGKTAKEALRIAASKLPLPSRIVVKPLKPEVPPL